MARAPKLSRDIQPLSEFRAHRKVLAPGAGDRPPSRPDPARSGAAVLVDIAEYERLVERSELAEGIRTAEAQLERGEGVDHAAAKKAVLKRLTK